MNRQDAIDHIWSLSRAVAQEFCCSGDETDELRAETEEAIAALSRNEG